MHKLPRLLLFNRYVLWCTVIWFPCILSALPHAIFGGDNSPGGSFESYAASVSPFGWATSITGQTPQGDAGIQGLAMNNSGHGLIGGFENGNVGYVALLSPKGVARKITGQVPQVNEEIFSADINPLGYGVIGGGNGYAAVVSPTGVATKITGDTPVAPANVRAVAINKEGRAIIGGNENIFDGYAAIVFPSGYTKRFLGDLPLLQVNAVAINGSGQAIVGGDDGYLALVSPSGFATKLPIPLLTNVSSVAINKKGQAIFGGDVLNTPFAAFVSPSGVITEVTGEVPQGTGPFNAEIAAVDINQSGQAIIAGKDRDNSGYVAFVSPAGVATRITGDTPIGASNLLTVAINKAGVGVIGGVDNNFVTGYGAVVSPSGVATRITGDIPIGVGDIYWVAILDSTVPKSWGPGNMYPNTLFALSTEVLTNHIGLMQGHPASSPNGINEISLTADAADVVRGNIPCEEDSKYSIWLVPFGLYAHNKKQSDFPSLTNWAGGAMLGFDYRGITNTIIGVGAAYAFNRVNTSGNLGHARFHQEFLTLYGSWGQKNIVIDAALWGGFYQMHNQRITLDIIRSRAHVNGWLLSPHLGISSPWQIGRTCLIIEPFVMFDWVNNWQRKVREQGGSGFNLRIGHSYTSMLRSEAGLRFLETLRTNWGDVRFIQKGSYANKKPFNAGRETTFFAGSLSTFSIEVFSRNVQNLGVFQFSTEFIPCSDRYPYGSINYQGEFGSSFQSHVVYFEIGMRF